MDYKESSFSQGSSGVNLRAVFPITEYLSMGLRYQFRYDTVTDRNNLVESVYIDEGNFTTSSVGMTLAYDVRDDRIKPTRGFNIVFSQDVAGMGGNTRYLRTRLNYDWYYPLLFIGEDWVVNLSLEAGHIFGLGQDIRINERYFLGGTRLRGFEQAGVGARLRDSEDALGGNTYFAGSVEVFIPLGAVEEFGITASAFVDFGTLYGVDGVVNGQLCNDEGDCEVVLGSDSIRMSAGIGFSWKSPFGPIRFDFAKAIRKESFDQTQFFQFNVGTRF